MSKYQEYKNLEQKLAAALKELDTLKEDEDVKATQAFIVKLKEMAGDISCADFMAATIEVFGPSPVKSACNSLFSKVEDSKRATGTRQPREEKRYVNPYTKEEVVCKKAKGLVLEWIKEYGKDVVEGWVQK
ncbi:hypothetical protein F3I62_19115 [Pseudomonas sp. R-28-1W-6]|uniref:hypothetical protein n=1 Tax=Pseudomonas sp. R-28-1W-6 TaxID=2650101 RepID=UPI0013660171|nr:hypothetical protein [Pseudomonas sp. R-28-1W-6]MWV14217.1 hypothetical protein [Pseudomonas sp. R-28-1W-6]